MKAAILSDRLSRAARLELDCPPDSAWELFAGTAPDHIDFTAAVLRGTGPGVFPLALPLERRNYYALRIPAGDTRLAELFLAEQRLPLEGGYNFRDLGGLPVSDGSQAGQTRWGLVFRTDGLDALTEADLQYLNSIKPVTLVDFRTHNERRRAPDRLPSSLKNALHLPIFPGSMSHEDFERACTPAESQAVMCRMYRLFITEEPILENYREFFRLLADPANLPLLFHCSAGKDRTGLAAALFLLALGLDRAAVMRDYMLSAEYLKGKYPPGDDFYSVRPEYLLAALEEIEARHGSVENFLRLALQVDLEKLRRLFLAPAFSRIP